MNGDEKVTVAMNRESSHPFLRVLVMDTHSTSNAHKSQSSITCEMVMVVWA